jgi:general L-amino acid transport system substrate-binding protein
MSRGQFIRRTGVGAAGVGAAMTGMSSVSHAAMTQAGSTLREVQDRGYLRAAVQTLASPGFYDPATDVGIEADFGRAMAAAIFGDLILERVNAVPSEGTFEDLVDDYIEFVLTDSNTRFTKLRDKEVDVGFMVCTWTFERDIFLGTLGSKKESIKVNSGFHFGPTYYYDGANILVWSDYTGIPAIAVGAGTSTEGVLRTYLESNPGEFTIETFVSSDAAQLAWEAKETDGLASDESNLKSLQTRPWSPSGTWTDHTELLLPLVISKEPLTPFVREDDRNWSDILRWVMFALFDAEEQEFYQTNHPTGWGANVAPALGLPNSWASYAIKAVGNYGEIWQRNLIDLFSPNPSPFVDRGLNRQWDEYPPGTPLLYAFPGIKV